MVMMTNEGALPKQGLRERLREFEQLCRLEGIPHPCSAGSCWKLSSNGTTTGPPSRVYKAVCERLPEISITTVYHVLDTLCRLGWAGRAHGMGATARFDGNVARYHRLICTPCSRVVDLEEGEHGELVLPRGKAARIRSGRRLRAFDWDVCGLPEARKRLDREQ